MRKNQISLFTLFLLLSGLVFSTTLRAQNATDLRINELLVHNDSNYVDDFGRHGAWIEVFNTAYNSVDMGGMYLTDDLANPTKYRIPKGQPITQIATRSFIVFWADDMSENGILHLNFQLKDGGIIGLFDANGKTLIDSVSIPKNSQHDVTWGRTVDGGEKWAYLNKTTPNSSNVTIPPVSGGEKFGEVDPKGIGMTIIAMGVVFSALIVLFLFFKLMGWSINRNSGSTSTTTSTVEPKHTKGVSGEVNAAIAMALYMYRNQLHDHENTVVTINQVSRTYSPWSSKIYGMTRFPRS